jgi:hypothetical protein
MDERRGVRSVVSFAALDKSCHLRRAILFLGNRDKTTSFEKSVAFYAGSSAAPGVTKAFCFWCHLGARARRWALGVARIKSRDVCNRSERLIGSPING